MSGLSFTWDPGADSGDRVVDVTVGGEPLDDRATYTLATNDFVAGGGDGYTVFEDASRLIDENRGQAHGEHATTTTPKPRPLAPPHMTDSVQSLIDEFRAEAERERDPGETPDVGIVMGSDSDLETMFGAYEALTKLGFEEITDYDDPPASDYTFETYVVSAHRTPDLMYAYAETARDRGLEVIIAGAGGKSADLPNMTASIAYPLPVIGVPVQEKSVDSVIGMPTGAPITAVDAGKSFNAALSAVQVLARANPELEGLLEEYHEDLREGVGEDSRGLHERGTVAYRESMGG